jgi:hypothetical protein
MPREPAYFCLDQKGWEVDDPSVAVFRVVIDQELEREQHGRLQKAAFRWRVQLGLRRNESGPWKQDWGVQYEVPGTSETDARARVVEVLGADLGNRLIITPV